MSMNLKNYRDFEKDLTVLINKYSFDTHCNTPDFILAELLASIMFSFGATMRTREVWLGSKK